MSNIEKKGQDKAQMSRTMNPSYIMNALVEEINKPFVPRDNDDRVYDPEATFLDVIIQTTVTQAAYGDRHARKEIFDRIDGKPVQQISLTQLMILLDQNRDLIESLRDERKAREQTIDAEKD